MKEWGAVDIDIKIDFSHSYHYLTATAVSTSLAAERIAYRHTPHKQLGYST